MRDKSRTPLNSKRKLTGEVIFRIVAIRAAHKHWGADKIRAILKREHVVPLPGRTTIHRVLKQTGLINLPKRRRVKLDNVRLHQGRGSELKINDEWTIDFKGWWKSRDGTYKCYPLTIRDAKSRYILGVTLLRDAKEESVRQAMIAIFKQYGLPKSIRSDNGTPFACTQALLGLSKLSVWWLRLGIELNRGRVGCPQDITARDSKTSSSPLPVIMTASLLTQKVSLSPAAEKEIGHSSSMPILTALRSVAAMKMQTGLFVVFCPREPTYLP